MIGNEQRRPGGGGAADVSLAGERRACSTLHRPRHATSSYPDGGNRLVKLTSLWERQSAKGTRYLSGFLGDAQIVAFLKGEREHPTRQGETVLVWELFIQERDPARRPGGQAR